MTIGWDVVKNIHQGIQRSPQCCYFQCKGIAGCGTAQSNLGMRKANPRQFPPLAGILASVKCQR